MATADKPGVIAPPPLLMLGTLIVALVLDRLMPVDVLPAGWGTTALVIGISLMALGIGVAVSGLIAFHRAGTNVEPHKPALVLVGDGPYRYTRNPMYIGLILCLLGISVISSTDWGLPMAIVLWQILHHGVVLREEAYLTAKFGQPYTDFLARTHRWILF